MAFTFGRHSNLPIFAKLTRTCTLHEYICSNSNFRYVLASGLRLQVCELYRDVGVGAYCVQTKNRLRFLESHDLEFENFVGRQLSNLFEFYFLCICESLQLLLLVRVCRSNCTFEFP